MRCEGGGCEEGGCEEGGWEIKVFISLMLKLNTDGFCSGVEWAESGGWMWEELEGWE